MQAPEPYKAVPTDVSLPAPLLQRGDGAWVVRDLFQLVADTVSAVKTVTDRVGAVSVTLHDGTAAAADDSAAALYVLALRYAVHMDLLARDPTVSVR